MPIPLDLRPRPIGTWLTPEDRAVTHPDNPPDGSHGWLDSSLELQHGLDVLELTVDVVLPGVPVPI